jgi:hypothetical protein
VTRLSALLFVGLLTACVATQEVARKANENRSNEALPLPPAVPRTGLRTGSRSGSPGGSPADPVVCRVGPDGEPAVADRGIGGTGAPVPASRVADRGIGGTGIGGTGIGGTGIGGSGIGGTGIVGVVTGFASVCVDGLEVAYDNSALVDVDGQAASPAALRAGQIVVIQAQGPAGAPSAQTISVRREVTGRIEAVELGSGTLTIAGQPVSVPAGTWGADKVQLGDWVAVSGLRRDDGMLVASRLDIAPAGSFTARGQVVRDADTVRVGQLVLHGAAAADLKDGEYVKVSGQYADDQAQVGAAAPDRLFPNPAAYFGASVNHLVVQGFVRVANGAVWLNGLKLAAGPNVHGQAGADGIAIVSLERKPDGSYTAVGLHYTDHLGPASGTSQSPGGGSRGDALPPPPVRHSPLVVSSVDPSSVPSAGGQPAAATISSATDTVISTGATDTTTPAAPVPTPTPTAAATTPTPTATTTTPTPTPTATTMTPTPTATTTTPTPTATTTTPTPTPRVTTTTPIPTPAGSGSGAGIESLGSPTAPTSQLMSSNSPGANTTFTPAKPWKVAGTKWRPAAGHSVIIRGSTNSPTASQFLGAVTTLSSATIGTEPATGTPALSSTEAKSKSTKTIGTSSGKLVAPSAGHTSTK